MVDRLGIENRRLHLEARIRSIERALGDSVRGIVPGINDVDVESVIPTPDGFSVVLGATNITVKWEDPNIPVTDFDFFEIQFALDSSFLTGLVTEKTKSTKYTFIDGDPQTTYYTRMRVALNDGRVSDYTATLNTVTGQIVTADIDSITEPASAHTVGTISVGAGADVTVQSATITAIGKSVVILASTGAQPFVTAIFRLRRNGTTLVAANMTAQPLISFAYVDEAPGSGSVTYTIDIENTGGAARTAHERSLIVFEVQVL